MATIEPEFARERARRQLIVQTLTSDRMSPPPLPDPKPSSLGLALFLTACGGQTSDEVRDRGSETSASDVIGQGGEGSQSEEAGQASDAYPGPDNSGEESSKDKADTDPATIGGAAGDDGFVIETGTGTAGAQETPGDTGPAEQQSEEDVIPQDPYADCNYQAIELPNAAPLLAESALRHDQFARRTLYSWTTPEQIEELRADSKLLTRSMTSEGERGRASDVLAEHAEKDELAALLSGPQFDNKRFGWANPWATLSGSGGESYGDRLLEITLHKQAWIASIRIDDRQELMWAFSDVEGNPVDAAEVLQNPERLAAAYFVDEREAGCGTLGSIGSTFREYFICNESMIESWAAYTPSIRAELDGAIRLVRAVIDDLEARDCDVYYGCVTTDALEAWEKASFGQAGGDYLASLAFPHYEYALDRGTLRRLLEALEQVPFEEPVEHHYEN